MARYIDADAFLEKMKKTNRYFDVKYDIEDMPTADVVPKSEVEKLVQDVTRLEQEKDALIKNYAECMKDYAKEIFEEIEKVVEDAEFEWGTIYGVKLCIAELKKKYIKGD